MFAHNLTRDEATTRSGLLRDRQLRDRTRPDRPRRCRAAVDRARDDLRLDLGGAVRGDRSGTDPHRPDRRTGARRVAERRADSTRPPSPDPGCRSRPVGGENELTVQALCRYSRSGEGLHRFVDPADQLVYLYTQFEVSEARRVFACFEQPDLKATYTLDVLAPPDWTVIANSTAEAPVAVDEHTSRWHFPTTVRSPPIWSGWSPAITPASTTSTPRPPATLPMSILCRRSVLAHLDAERIFAITKAGFDVFEPNFDFAVPVRQVRPGLRPRIQHGRDGERRLHHLARRPDLPVPDHRRRPTRRGTTRSCTNWRTCGSATWSPWSGGTTCG